MSNQFLDPSLEFLIRSVLTECNSKILTWLWLKICCYGYQAEYWIFTFQFLLREIKPKTKTGLCRKGSDNSLSEYWNTYYSIFICGQLLSIKSSHYVGVQKNIITMYADCSVRFVLKSYLICAEKVCSDDCQAENESNPWVA